MVKFKVLLSQSFFFCRRFGLGQDKWVKPGQPGQMGQTVVGGDVIVLEGTCKRVTGEVMHETDVDVAGVAWLIVWA